MSKIINNIEVEQFKKDGAILIKSKFDKIKIKYYGLLTLFFFPFYLSPNNSIFFKFLKNCDQLLFKINIFKKLAWSTLIIAEKN